MGHAPLSYYLRSTLCSRLARGGVTKHVWAGRCVGQYGGCMQTLVITNVEPFRDPAGRRDLRVSVVVECRTDEELECWRALVGKRCSVQPVED
jgi:hypothetical protein